jgi:hypothetical protein
MRSPALRGTHGAGPDADHIAQCTWAASETEVGVSESERWSDTELTDVVLRRSMVSDTHDVIAKERLLVFDFA